MVVAAPSSAGGGGRPDVPAAGMQASVASHHRPGRSSACPAGVAREIEYPDSSGRLSKRHTLGKPVDFTSRAPPTAHARESNRVTSRDADRAHRSIDRGEPVSYTHLTLP